jgi:2-oxoglutarate ferredoxin oxidoreductase subunit beta
MALAITMGASFVARGFAGEKEHLGELIRQAILFKGTALVDILQPCISFNKINTYQWYRERVFRLEAPLTDRYEALKTADLWGEKIPIGVIYKNDADECRKVKEIFRQQPTQEDIACQVDMRCMMMR